VKNLNADFFVLLYDLFFSCILLLIVFPFFCLFVCLFHIDYKCDNMMRFWLIFMFGLYVLKVSGLSLNFGLLNML